MKRVFIIGPSDQKETVLQYLQEAGVIHVEPAAKMTGDWEKKNASVLQEVRRIGQICEGVSRFHKRQPKLPVQVPEAELLSFCEQKLAMLQELQNRKQSLSKLISELRPWGDFDPEELRSLERDGIYVQRFRMEGRPRTPVQFPEDAFVEVVSEKPVMHFYTVRLGGPVDIPQATPLRHPEGGLKAAQRELEEMSEREERLMAELAGAADRIEVLKRQHLSALNEASYIEHLGRLYAEELLFGVQGWVPVDLEAGLLKKIESSGLPLLARTRDPLEEETPPTLLKNNWFIRLIEPVLKLYGLPAYSSLDPSYFFAPFMILFFGICLGDAGYGLVFLLVSTWIKKKWGHLAKGLPLAMKLCQAFSVSAILIGVITGSVFGYSFKNREWVLVDLDLDVGNPMILFYSSLGLGLLHLTLSYLLGVLRASSRHEQLQKLGLVGVLWGGAFLISRSIWFSEPTSVANAPFEYAGWGLLGLGLFLTFLFASDSKKWLVRIGLGLWSVYRLTGLIGDLLSYARLFGLGIATTAIAAVMNQLAGMAYEATGPILGIFFAILLLILGHAFNLALSALGSTIHSARLHFVEAFKSFFQPGGIEYKPFKVERGS
jgi:V/A-type H+/Na+-transporting ATPase subunit I